MSGRKAQIRTRLPDPLPGRERWRLPCALLLSLILHALLLRLAFDGQGLGISVFKFLWGDRRVAVSELHVELPSPPVTAVTPHQAPPEESGVADGATGVPVLPPVRTQAPAAGPAAVAIAPSVAAAENGDVVPPAVESPAEAPMPAPAPVAVAEVAPSLQPLPAMRVIAVERAIAETWVVPPQPEPAQVAAAEPAVADFGRFPVPRASLPPAERQQVDEGAAARLADMAQEVERQALERREFERQETARQEAARQEAARQEAARQEAARQEAARQEAARQEAARQEAARQEAARQEAARQEAARQEAARAEAARAEAARTAAARDAAARQQAARDEAARTDRDEAERREARLRAIGRQLDEEAARREASTVAVRSPSSLPYSLSSARRYRLFGRADPNAEIVRYAESWSRKIELNFTLDLWREAVKQPHADPVVLVAVRSDGSIENMSFERSSGVPAIDDAVRRIVDGQRPFPAFPPELARDYDVIEIRRSWHFDTAVRLY